MYAIGLDIGGTKIAAALVDENGCCRFRNELPSIPDDSEAMFQQVVTCIKSVVDSSGYTDKDIIGIGAGVPGKVDAERGIAIHQNNLPWRNFPLIQRLKVIFPFNITIDNDVAMAAYGEWVESGKDSCETFVYVTWSTGVSSYVIHNGEHFRGKGFAGEIGLAFFGNEKQRLETMVSGPSISEICSEKLNRFITTKEAILLFKDGNQTVKSLLNPVIQKLAKGIYTIICLLDPHKIILGGSVITNNPFLLELLKGELSYLVIPEQIHSMDNIRVSSLKGDAGIIGSGLSAFNQIKEVNT